MLSNYIIPVIVIIIVFYGFFKKIDIYDCFLEGSVDGLKTVVSIVPVILAMILAVNIFVKSGILSLIGGTFKDIVPMIILRPISGNATLAYLSNIYQKYVKIL